MAVTVPMGLEDASGAAGAGTDFTGVVNVDLDSGEAEITSPIAFAGTDIERATLYKDHESQNGQQEVEKVP